MARSNQQAVDQNNIPEEERLDFIVPRNGSVRLWVRLTHANGAPIDLTGQTIVAAAKTSYQATSEAFAISIEDRNDANGEFYILYSAALAKKIGIDVLDLVHDCRRTPSGEGAQPIRVFAGLIILSKGVS